MVSARNFVTIFTVFAAVLFAFSGAAGAGEPTGAAEQLPDDLIYLYGGDYIKGSFVRVEDGKIFYRIKQGDKFVEESIAESKVRRIRRLKPDGTSEVIYPVPVSHAPAKKPARPKKAGLKKPKPVSKETREEYTKQVKELAASRAKSEYELGLWCEKNGMENESRIHYARALELDNGNEEYKLKNGYKKIGGKLVPLDKVVKATKEEIEQETIDETYKGSKNYVIFAGLWVTRGLQKFLDKQPDNATRFKYVTAISRLAQRRKAFYSDLSLKEKRLIRYLAPLEQKRICPKFDPKRTPAPPEKKAPEFDRSDLKRKK